MEKTHVLYPTRGLKILLTMFVCSACGLGFDLKSGDVSEEEASEDTGLTSSEEQNTTENDTANSWENDPIFGEANLPSVLEELDATACDDMSEDLQHPGATSYFVGTYIRDGSRWIGREKWILFPNAYWEASGGVPCEVSWDMEITEEDLITCLACDFALNVDAAISSSSTSCPQELWNSPSEQYWSSIYEVLMQNGNSVFYFQSSGQAFGWGYASESAINFVSEPDCKWF